MQHISAPPLVSNLYAGADTVSNTVDMFGNTVDAAGDTVAAVGDTVNAVEAVGDTEAWLWDKGTRKAATAGAGARHGQGHGQRQGQWALWY